MKPYKYVYEVSLEYFDPSDNWYDSREAIYSDPYFEAVCDFIADMLHFKPNRRNRFYAKKMLDKTQKVFVGTAEYEHSSVDVYISRRLTNEY